MPYTGASWINIKQGGQRVATISHEDDHKATLHLLHSISGTHEIIVHAKGYPMRLEINPIDMLLKEINNALPDDKKITDLTLDIGYYNP